MELRRGVLRVTCLAAFAALVFGGSVRGAWKAARTPGPSPSRLPALEAAFEHWRQMRRADGPSLLWVTPVSEVNAPSSDYGHAVAVDAGGNVIATGQTTTAETGLDILTVKMASNGQLLWQRRYASGGLSDDFAGAVAVGPENQVFVVGGVWVPDQGYRACLLRYSADGDREEEIVLPADAGDWVVALDLAVRRDTTFVLGMNYTTRQPVVYAVLANGDVLWMTPVAFAHAEQGVLPNRMALDGTGHLSIAATVWNSQGTHWAVAQLNTRSRESWSVVLDGRGEARAVCSLTDGSVVATGVAYTDQGQKAVCTARLSPSGQILWKSMYTGSEGRAAEGVDVVADTGGSVYVGCQLVGANHRPDFLLIKMDAGGHRQWTFVYDSPTHGTDRCLAVDLDPRGRVVVSGTSYSGVTGVPEAVVVALDGSGHVLWTWTSSPRRSVSGAVAGNCVALTGRAYPEAEGSSSEIADFYLVALDLSGECTGELALDGPGACVLDGVDLGVDQDGNIHITANRDVQRNKGWVTLSVSPEGHVKWAYQGGGTGSEHGRGTSGSATWKMQEESASAVDQALAANGTTVVTGWRNLESRGTSVVTVAVDGNGDELWKAVEGFAEPALVFPSHVTVDAGGRAFVSGQVFDVDVYAYKLLVFCYGPDGSPLWRFARVDTPSREPTERLILPSSDGKVLISGGPYVLAKLDSLGNPEWWVKPEDLGADFHLARELRKGPDGSFVVVGAKVYPVEKMLLARVAPDGHVLWHLWDNRFVNVSSSRLCLDVAGNGRIVVAGVAAGEGDSQYTLVTAWSATGTHLWDVSYTGTEALDVRPVGVVVKKNGTSVVLVEEQKRFFVDAVLFAVDSTGNLVWEKAFASVGGNVEERPFGLTLDADENILLATTSGTSSGRNRVVTLAKFGSAASGVRDAPRHAPLPGSPVLRQNYPNPFNTSTEVRFWLPRDEKVRLTVLDVAGREVAILLDRFVSAGEHYVVWKAAHEASGVYFCRLATPGRCWTRKMILLK